MNYIELEITITPKLADSADIVIAALSELEFESFEETETGVKAYVQIAKFYNAQTELILKSIDFGSKLHWQSTEIEEVNWNEEWEKNFFEPIVIGNDILVRSSFHNIDQNAKYEIIIDPKMSFGTGHHATTSLVMQTMLEQNFEQLRVLDMGCGTAILAILAAKLGATSLLAIDIDDWVYSNAIENLALNAVNNVEVKIGDVDLLADEKFDLILANINRNILINQIPSYRNALKLGNKLIMSGFYLSDLEVITQHAEASGFKLVSYKEQTEWVAALFEVKN